MANKKGPVVKHWFAEVEAMDNDGIFKVRQGLLWGLYDSANDRFLIPIDCHSIDEVKGSDCCVLYINRGGKISYYNFDKKKLFLSECDEVVALDDERSWLIKARKGKEWQIVDLKKGRAVSLMFDEVEALVDFPDQQLFMVRVGDMLGLYDVEKEKTVMPVEFDEVIEDDVNLFRVSRGNRWGLYDTHLETIVIGLEFEKISCVDNDVVYQVELGGKIGFVKLQS